MKLPRFAAPLVAAIFAVTLHRPVTAGVEPANWPQFRGPNGSGLSPDDKPAPTHFGPDTNRLWQTELPRGHSSPCIWGDRIFVTGFDATNKALQTICLDRASGKVLWRKAAPSVFLEKSMHEFNSPAASTPATDGAGVYVHFGGYGALAYDFKGEELWKRPLPMPPTDYGNASSPIAYDGLVLLQRDGNGTNSHVLALDGKSGQIRWTVERPLHRESYSTPMLWRHDGITELVTVGNGRLDAYDARDGAARWWTSGLSFFPIAVAVAGDGMLFASSAGAGSESEPPYIDSWEEILGKFDKNKDGKVDKDEVPEKATFHWRKSVPAEIEGNTLSYRWLLFTFFDADKDGVFTTEDWKGVREFTAKNPNSVMAIRPGGSGNVSKSHVAWKGTRGIPDMPSPLHYRDRLYLMMDGGMLTSYDASTGKLVMDRERVGLTSQFAASPVASGGNLYLASVPGKVAVVKAADTLEVLAINDLKERIIATPAVLEGRIYIRSEYHLSAFGP